LSGERGEEREENVEREVSGVRFSYAVERRENE